MAEIKAYTDISQSKKLAEFLPLESADCFWDYDDLQKYHRINWFEDGYNKDSQLRLNENNVCAWSLAALLTQLPYKLCDDDGNLCYLQITKEDNVYQLEYYIDTYGHFETIATDRYEYFVDAYVDMIIHLHKLNLL